MPQHAPIMARGSESQVEDCPTTKAEHIRSLARTLREQAALTSFTNYQEKLLGVAQNLIGAAEALKLDTARGNPH
jgi:hypothetical protein